MDDVSWSEPTPRSRRGAELAPPEWLAPAESRFAQTGERFVDEPTPLQESFAHELPARERRRRRPDAPRRSESPVSGFDVDDHLDEDLREVVGRWQAEMAEEPAVVEYARERDDEEIWGPRPRLMAIEPGGRRTVVITGHVNDRHVTPRSTGRDGLPLHARHGFAADRTAMWAVLLCVILLLVALTSH